MKWTPGVRASKSNHCIHRRFSTLPEKRIPPILQRNFKAFKIKFFINWLAAVVELRHQVRRQLTNQLKDASTIPSRFVQVRKIKFYDQIFHVHILLMASV